MTGLNPSALIPYFRLQDDPDALIYNAKHVTHLVGIDELIQGAVIDDFLFQPCGYMYFRLLFFYNPFLINEQFFFRNRYSCNGVVDNIYFTIHITPGTYLLLVTVVMFSFDLQRICRIAL